MTTSYKYICLYCRNGMLISESNGMRCQLCEAIFPIVLGVPLLIKNAKYIKLNSVNKELAQKFTDLLGLPINVNTYSIAQTILSGYIEHDSEFISSESKQFPSRIKSSFPDKWTNELDHLLNKASRTFKGLTINQFESIDFEIEISYLPDKIKRGKFFSSNFRIKNTGKTILSSKNKNPIILSGHWISDEGMELETLRTNLLIDLVPGAEITMPVRLQAPMFEGKYRFRLSLLSEHKRWFLGKQIWEVEITSEDFFKRNSLENFIILDQINTYFLDHQYAIEMLREYTFGLVKEDFIALEIGGNFSPCLQSILPQFLNLDVDLRGLQFAKLRGDNVTHICADAFDLPFPDSSIDLVAIFSSLHHFPDPASFLINIKDKVKKNGVIAVMCEPVGHPFSEDVGSEYIEELMDGINEQAFNLEEYQIIFRKAGLKIKKAVVNGGSLKAFLEKI